MTLAVAVAARARMVVVAVTAVARVVGALAVAVTTAMEDKLELLSIDMLLNVNRV